MKSAEHDIFRLPLSSGAHFNEFFGIVRLCHSNFQRPNVFDPRENAVELLLRDLPHTFHKLLLRIGPSNDIHVCALPMVAKPPEVFAIGVGHQARYSCPNFHSCTYRCSSRTFPVSTVALWMRSGSLKVLVMPTLGYFGVR